MTMTTIDLSDGGPLLGVHRFGLPCGLDVAIHSDPTSTLVAVVVWYRVGSTDEAPGQSGFAHLYEHLFKNSIHLGGRHHYDVLRRGGSVSANASTSPDRTSYHEILPAGGLDLALWLESDRMGYFLPAFDDERLVTQKDVVRNERRQRYENAAYGAERFAIAELLYPVDHPQRYLTIGRHEDIQGATREQVADFYRTWYVPANAQLVIAGAIDPAEGEAAVWRYFGSFPPSLRPPRPPAAAPRPSAPIRIAIEDRFATITRIHRVWHGPPQGDPDQAALEVLGSALSSTGTGPLWQRLIHDPPSLAVRVAAWFQATRLGGEFHVAADLRGGTDPQAVRDILDAELERARGGSVGARDIARVVARREAIALWRLESVGQRAGLIQRGLLYDDDPQSLARELARDATLDPDQVQAAARRWLDPSAMIEVETVPGAGGDRPRAEAPVGDEVE